MKIVFLTNYYNHHQKDLSNAMYEYTKYNYFFIETEKISEERLNMGWGEDQVPEYVLQNYTNQEAYVECQKMIDNADVVIIGSAPYELIKNRLKEKKLTFNYSERLYKKGYQYYKMPIRIIRHYKKYTRHKNLYLLCASAYTAADFAKSRTFVNKSYKWGYFPEIKRYENVDMLIESKSHASILWVGRFIEWKHPEIPIRIAKKLRNEGYCFTINLIGTGELEDNICNMIIENDLQDCVHVLGAMKPDKVREYMERSQIFLFTSDRSEGWGAVLNEAMNSGCAVVASHAIGSVPFLLNHKENGLIYKDGDEKDLYEKVKKLIDDKAMCKQYGKKAYKTINEEWNAQVAAYRFIQLAGRILRGEMNPALFDSGPCCKGEILKDEWFCDEQI